MGSGGPGELWDRYRGSVAGVVTLSYLQLLFQISCLFAWSYDRLHARVVRKRGSYPSLLGRCLFLQALDSLAIYSPQGITELPTHYTIWL